MQPHRSSALGYASAASAVHSRVCGACTAEAAASETSGLSVGGCIRARSWILIGPDPVLLSTLRSNLYLFVYLMYRDESETQLERGPVAQLRYGLSAQSPLLHHGVEY